MEQLRYCTVGSFYKNPKNPVWVMGSETHLTGMFLVHVLNFVRKVNLYYGKKIIFPTQN